MREPHLLHLASAGVRSCARLGIIRAVEDISEGRVRLLAGTLYSALDRLVEGGLLLIACEEVVDGRTRRYYAITRQGEAELAAQVDRLVSNAAARSCLGLRPA